MSGRYTAGVATHYPPATVLTAAATHQALAEGYPIGMRFHSAPVVRLADAKPCSSATPPEPMARGASTPLPTRAGRGCGR